MNISFSTIPGNLNMKTGFGVAGFNIVRSLQKLGHTVPFQDAQAPIELFFAHPTYWKWSSKDSHRIGYTPWESSHIPPEWQKKMMLVDEVWATNQIIARWIKAAGTHCPVRVYPHGIEPEWTPKKRKPVEKIKFLHMGEPAPRKGGEMAVKAFRAAFGENKNVHLTLKAHRFNSARIKDSRGSILGKPDMYSNVSLFTKELEFDQLVAFVHMHDCMVYPSWGEGWGLIPFQALATGMPTICTSKWADYCHYLGDLGIDSRLADSPWPDIHPGKMLEPSFDDLVDKYRYVADNYGKLSEESFQNSFRLHEEYDWQRVTEQAFAHLL